MIAAWQPHHPEYPEGVVLINRDHTVLQEQIRHWQGQFADYHAEQIEQDVLHAYGQIAVARVAHSEHLSSLLSRKKIEDDLRSPGALTMSLLGLLAEEAVIAPRLRGKFRKKREAA